MDRSLPSPSVLLHDPVLTEMGPGMGDPGSDTKGGKKKKKINSFFPSNKLRTAHSAFTFCRGQ